MALSKLLYNIVASFTFSIFLNINISSSFSSFSGFLISYVKNLLAAIVSCVISGAVK